MQNKNQNRIHRRKHLLSVDLESWIFSRTIDKKNFSISELKRLDDGYSPKALQYLLNTFKKYDQKITFFIVGKLEEVYPGTIEKILEAGHEVGWHTHSHPDIVSKEILVSELEKSAKILVKYNIKGFQAPTITFFRAGYKILRDYGFTYSSSIYGNSNIIYEFDNIYEIPVSVSKVNFKPKKNEIKFPANMQTSKMFTYGIPYGSSFFWGILGKQYYSRKLTNAESHNRMVNLFIHEWQLKRPNSKEYQKDVSIFSKPFFFPYKINVTSLFEHLLENHEFYTFKEHIKMYEKNKKT